MNNSSYLDFYKRNKELKYDNYDPNHLDLEHKYNDSAFYNNTNQSQNLNNNNFLTDSNNNNNNQKFTYQQEN